MELCAEEPPIIIVTRGLVSAGAIETRGTKQCLESQPESLFAANVCWNRCAFASRDYLQYGHSTVRGFFLS